MIERCNAPVQNYALPRSYQCTNQIGMGSKCTKLSLFIAGLAGTTPCFSQTQASPATYSCSAYIVNTEGTWRASRDMVEANGTATSSRDTYEWQPTEVIKFAEDMNLRLEIVYQWPTKSGPQRNIPEKDIMVDLHFTFAAKNGTVLKKPDRSWLHFYRSADEGKQRHPLATSLSTMTLWYQFGTQGLRTGAILSLDDLLAFGTGHDLLKWEIRSQPDMLGRTNIIAKGNLPIAPLRTKVAEILKLRALLDKKSPNFRKQCQIVPIVPLAAPPLPSG